MKNLLLRLFGLLVIVKTLIPPVVFFVFIFCTYSITTQTGKIAYETYNKTTADLAMIQTQINAIKLDIQGLKDKIQKK